MATQVKFVWHDDAGDYHVWATVDDSENVKILEIETEDGDSCDISDWTSREQYAIKAVARKEAANLEVTNDGRDDSEEDDGFDEDEYDRDRW